MQESYDKLAKLTGRQYHLFDYFGDPKAEDVMVIMGSGAEAAEETVSFLNAKRGAKLGLIKGAPVPAIQRQAFHRLCRQAASSASPGIDEGPGAHGEPLFLDVVSVVNEAVREGGGGDAVGGRYGLSSKEFHAADVRL